MFFRNLILRLIILTSKKEIDSLGISVLLSH